MRSLDDLTSYVYGFLDEPDAAAMRAHVEECAECAERVERIEAEHRLFGGALAREDGNPWDRAVAVHAVVSRRGPERPGVRRSRLLPALRMATGVAAVVCVAAIVSSLRGRRPTDPDVRPAAADPTPTPALAYLQDRGMGSLVAHDEEGRPVGELGLKSHRVSVEIVDGIAKTTVEENFENHTDRRLEGTFHFPLPPDASISRLALEVNGKIEEGTCLDRGRAREVFEDIVRKMKDPALLEWMPGGIFKCRVFPIEPRATKRVIVAYTQALPFFRGRMNYVYPLASEKTETHPPEEVRVDLLARFGGRLTKVESPSHRVDVQRRNPNEAAMTYVAFNVRPKNDFVAVLETEDDELRVVPHKGDGEDGYFALFLTPRGAPERMPDRYVFVLDTSASVSAPEFEVEKRLVRAMMEKAVPGDRFEIVASNVEVAFSGEVDLRQANEFLDRLRPTGGSDLLLGLRSAPEGEIIYIGKGVATFGETDPAKILEGAKGRRIRSIGVGSRANVDLLQRLGGHLRVSPSDDVTRRVAEIAATLGSPVLSDIRVSGGDAVYDVAGVRDLFFGERLVAAGRYRGQTARIVVTGRGYHREVEVTLPLKEEGNNYVRRLWAQRKIAGLLAQGESTKREVTELGVKHQIMTPYTSFLVLESEQMWKDYHLKREVQKPDQVLAKRDWIGVQGMEIVARTLVRRMEGKSPAERAAAAEAFSRFIQDYASPDPGAAGEYRRILIEVTEKVVPRSGPSTGAAERVPPELVARELESLRNSLDDVGVDIINRSNVPIPAVRESILTFPLEGFPPEYRTALREYFRTLNESPEKPREIIEYSELRTTTNQYGGLEFTLGEAAGKRTAIPMPPGFFDDGSPVLSNIPVLGHLFGPRIPLEAEQQKTPTTLLAAGTRPDERTGMETSVFRVNHLERAVSPAPGVYRAKLEPGKFISGQPLHPVWDERILKNFPLRQVLERELTRNASGQTLGQLNYDPQTRVFIVRDAKAVLDRIGEVIQAWDVEPDQVLRSNVALLLRPTVEETVRRARQRVTVSFRNSTLHHVVEEFRRQTGWAVLLPPGSAPTEFPISEFIVQDEPAYAALRSLASGAGLAAEEGPDHSVVLSRRPRMSFACRDEDIRSVIDRIARASGVPVELPPSLRGTVTLNVNNVPWDEVLDAAVKMLNLTTVREKSGRVRVIQPDELLKGMETRVFRIRFLDPAWTVDEELVQVLEALLSRAPDGRTIGRLSFDGASKYCLVIDTHEVRARIYEVLSYLDVEPGKPLPPAELSRAYPDGVRRLLEEARRRLAAAKDQPGRDSEARTALRKVAAELERLNGGGSIDLEVVRCGENPNEVILGAGPEAGVGRGQFFAVQRDRKFLAIVSVMEVSPDHVRAGVWRGLAVTRILPGDRAARIRDVRAFVAALPEEVRRDLASAEGVSAIREKMGLKE